MDKWRLPDNWHSYEESVRWLKSGYNTGIVCGYQGLVVLDIDEPYAIDELGIRLPSTRTVITGSFGLHKYYAVDNPHPRHAILFSSDGKHLGEMQAEGQYVVAPGSIHPNGNPYRVENEYCSIAPIDYDGLVENFRNAGVVVNRSDEKKALDPLSIKNPFNRVFGRPDGVVARNDPEFDVTDIWSISSFESVGSQYIGSHPVHGSKTGRNLAIDPAENRWYCHRCKAGGGPIAALAVDSRIIKCRDAQPGNLRGDKFKLVIEEAKKRGLM